MKKLIVPVLLLLISCSRNLKVMQTTFFEFGTYITISIVDNNLNEKQFSQIINEIKDKCKYYNNIFNAHNPDSEVSRISLFTPNRFYNISEDMYTVLKEAEKFYKLTGGLFDVTIGRLTLLYNIPYTDKIPSQRAIQKALQYTGFTNIKLKNKKIMIKRRGIKIDPGGIAKGYIVDKLSEFLYKKGYKNFMVNIGGDLYVAGRNRFNKKWEIGIQNPVKKNSIIKVIKVSDKAVFTSGIYERYIKYKNRKYHHIINPETGYPVENNILSVTIIYRKGMTADAIATSIILMGTEDGIVFLNKNFKNLKYFIITSDNNKLKFITNME